MYRDLASSLRDSHRVIVPDHIGCGLSDKPDASDYDYTLSQRVIDLEFLLKEINATRKLTLVLHDWGGLIGSTFAARNPSLIDKLVIFNTAGFLLPAGKALHWSLRFCKHSKLAGFLIRQFNAFAVVAGYTGCHQNKLSAELRKAYKAPYDSWKNRVAILRFVHDIPLSPRDRSYAVVADTDRNLDRFQNTPALICWGEKDFIFDDSFLGEWIHRFPRAEVHRFPNGGHNILEDAGREIIPLVRKFLASPTPGS